MIACVSTDVWVFTVVDDILYHTPYLWNQWCGESGLPLLARDSCKFVYNYYYSLDAHEVDSGVVATVFLGVSLGCLFLLWVPKHGAALAALRTILIVAPLEILIFETGVYFLLNYWWTVHATEFLAGTPFSNEAIFWTSVAVLGVGLSIELMLRRSRGAIEPSDGTRGSRRESSSLPSLELSLQEEGERSR